MRLNNKPQIIKENGVDKFAVLSLKDYNLLLEAAEELESIKEFDNFIENPSEMFPADLVDRMILGKENPIVILRENRGMNQKDLAKKSDITTAYLSQLEAGKRKGSVDILKRISNALDVDLDDIV